MQAVRSLQNWIKTNTKIKAEDVIVDALADSTYLVSGNFAQADLKLFVGFVERSEDASGFAQIIYKWAQSQGRPLQKDLKFEALRIDNNTWDYYFWFDWMDKTSLGQAGEDAECCGIPTDPALADERPDSVLLNEEEINTNLVTHDRETLSYNDEPLVYTQTDL